MPPHEEHIRSKGKWIALCIALVVGVCAYFFRDAIQRLVHKGRRIVMRQHQLDFVATDPLLDRIIFETVDTGHISD